MNKNNLVTKMRYLLLLTVAFVAGCASNGQEISVVPAVLDTVAPTVTFTAPVNGQTAVPFDRKVSVAFSEAMDPATITTTTFTVTGPSLAVVPGAVAATGPSAVFTPTSPLTAGITYTATVTTGAKDLAGNALASNYAWSFTTGATADSIAPTVTITSPANTAPAVPVNRKIGISFSEVMDPLTVSTATVMLKGPGTTPVAGAVTIAGTSALFTPAANLANNTLYTATVTTGVKDLAGNAMAANYVFSFTTGLAADATKPTVIATINANGATNVPINTKAGATFSEVMDNLTITNQSFTLKQGATNVPGVVTYSGVNALFTPATILSANTAYTATITTVAKDLAGNALANNYVWSWTTAAAADTTRPTVILVNPADLATNVAVNSAVHATFSKAMDPLSINTASVTLKTGVTPVTGLVVYDAITKIATFTPSANLATNTTYTATIVNTAADLAGNTLLNNKVWSFTTAAVIVPPIVPPGSHLGSVGTYGIMATSAITNTGATTKVNGDVALEPGTSNGLLPAQVNGTIHINDTVSHQAFADLLVAYNYYKNLPPGVTITAGADLGALYPLGMPPGTYTSNSSMSINTHLILDGGGNANAVWVFQIGSSITTTTPLGTIELRNGANANNIFWVPTASATIGVGTTFYGTVIAGVSITGQTGAIINGRLLAGAIGAGTIALDTNTVNVP